MVCQVAFFICRQERSLIMQTSIEIIEEIQADASGLQKKLLTLPAPGEDISQKQRDVIDQAQKGLLGWRSWDLGKLWEAFTG